MPDADIKTYLLDLTLHHIKSRDTITKSILSIEENKENADLLITHKDKKQYVIVLPFPDDLSIHLKKLPEKETITLVLVNSKKNIDLVIKQWKSLVAYPNLSIQFVNPFSKVDLKWVISPSIHSRVCEERSVGQGLKSMSSGVEMTDEPTLKKKISVCQ
jgi:hypothetical protein